MFKFTYTRMYPSAVRLPFRNDAKSILTSCNCTKKKELSMSTAMFVASIAPLGGDHLTLARTLEQDLIFSTRRSGVLPCHSCQRAGAVDFQRYAHTYNGWSSLNVLRGPRMIGFGDVLGTCLSVTCPLPKQEN
eukprot:jgi/Botrbrau1/10504/Bobra.0133s0104.1